MRVMGRALSLSVSEEGAEVGAEGWHQPRFHQDPSSCPVENALSVRRKEGKKQRMHTGRGWEGVQERNRAARSGHREARQRVGRRLLTVPCMGTNGPRAAARHTLPRRARAARDPEAQVWQTLLRSHGLLRGQARTGICTLPTATPGFWALKGAVAPHLLGHTRLSFCINLMMEEGVEKAQAGGLAPRRGTSSCVGPRMRCAGSPAGPTGRRWKLPLYFNKDHSRP